MIHRTNEEALLEDKLVDVQDELTLVEQTGLEIPDTDTINDTWDEKPELNIYYDETEEQG